MIKKPLFWTNVVAISVTGLLIAGVAFGWNNPTGAPPGGNGAITVDSSGNVGIGTISPTSKLQVNGKLRISDGTQGLNKVLSSDASGIASWVNLAKGATVDHFDVWGIEDGIKSCTTIFSLMNSKSGLSGPGKILAGGHSRIYMATDGRWLFVVTAEDCSPENNQPGGYGLIPRTAVPGTAKFAPIPGYWSYKGSL